MAEIATRDAIRDEPQSAVSVPCGWLCVVAMRMNSPEGKQILALVRDGAFAHAGEVEAIELALGHIPKDSGRAVLDAGCGLDGTADYVARNGWGRVTGFDIDATSIERAKVVFPNCAFVAADVGTAGSLWQSTFDLIYCFNSVYAFPDQSRALTQLAETARSGATLVIFDYTDPEKRYHATAFANREEAALWQPLRLDSLRDMAATAGWKLESFADLTAGYLRWYEALVRRGDEHRDAVVTGHGAAAFEIVRAFYSALRDTIIEGALGGGIFTLRRP